MPWIKVPAYAVMAVGELKRLRRISGSGEKETEYTMKPSSPKIPSIIGTSVRHEDHSCITPPLGMLACSSNTGQGELTHVIGIRKLVVAAIKMNDPNQSKVLSLSQIDPSLGCSLRQMGTPTAASTQKGMLSQKIPR